MATKKIKITQYKSSIGHRKKTKDTLIALGLTKINQTVIHDKSPSILGMIRSVDYLVKSEEI